MTQRDENLITWVMMAAGFLGIVWWGSISMGFQRACETSCGNHQAITPVIDLQEECFCEESHGKWRKVDVDD